MSASPISYYKYHSPAGTLYLGATPDAISLCDWWRPEQGEETPEASPIIREAIRQLEEYFEGKRKDFILPLTPAGTPFQKEVWRALGKIPYGSTDSYSGLAAAIGRPGAARAVAGAVGANRLPILIPCHRIIRADGRLGGYRGGIPAKLLLLSLEARI